MSCVDLWFLCIDFLLFIINLVFPFIMRLGPHSFPHLSFIVVVSTVTLKVRLLAVVSTKWISDNTFVRDCTLSHTNTHTLTHAHIYSDILSHTQTHSLTHILSHIHTHTLTHTFNRRASSSLSDTFQG